MLGRSAYAGIVIGIVLVALFTFPPLLVLIPIFMIIWWALRGTKASRDRKQQLEVQRRLLKNNSSSPSRMTYVSKDGNWIWDGYQWVPRSGPVSR